MKIAPPRITCAEIGRLAPRLGPYHFSRSGETRWVVKTGSLSRFDGEKVVNERLPSTLHIYMMAEYQQKGAVLINSQILPFDLIVPFHLAGNLNDLSQYCDAVIFTPELYKDGEWIGSLGLNTSTGLPLRSEEVLQESFVKIDPSRVMILNLYDTTNAPYQGVDFHWAMGDILGSMKLDQLMIAQGMQVTDLSEDAHTLYAYAYQWQMIVSISANLASKYPEFVGSPEHNMYLEQMRKVDEFLFKLCLSVSDAEKDILLKHFNFNPPF